MTIVSLPATFGYLSRQLPGSAMKKLQTLHRATKSTLTDAALRVEQLDTAKHGIDVLEMAREYHASELPDVVFDELHVMEQITRVLADHDKERLNLFIAYINDQPASFIYGHASTHFTSRSVVTTQDMWYRGRMNPEGRGSSAAALALLWPFLAWSIGLGATRIVLSVTREDQDKVAKIGRMFNRLGFQQAGTNHILEIE